ncbi:uncharacterized protein LOC143291466 isoform X3 [Babylonia areolata]|uniref:uncharacterized protein LOC143291466 isoform X3 n=1 Tax=Babylonia areolata TaxID=304850 RepID=UPI003FD2EBBE
MYVAIYIYCRPSPWQQQQQQQQQQQEEQEQQQQPSHDYDECRTQVGVYVDQEDIRRTDMMQRKQQPGGGDDNDGRVIFVESSDDYLEPVARRVESAGTAGDDHSAVSVTSSDDYLEPVARRVESAAPHYIEILPDSANTPRWVPPPVPSQGPYEDLVVDEIGQRSVYTKLDSLNLAPVKEGKAKGAPKKALLPKLQK